MNFKTRLNTVNTFIFDVDGVISEEKVYFLGEEPIKSFNNKDAYALQLAIKKGYTICIISGGKSTAIRGRLERLGITNLFFSQHDKLACYKDFIAENNIEENTITYMGDDLPDWEVMKRVGVPVCPQDAAPEIKEICIYISPKKGGDGCVRDIVEQVMRCQGKWEISKW
ncbi:MAG: HAD hydrolase family protein [Bacteroidia bacterium]|nr:HAD hydrolase family protein [Bacteroidia bacterium]